MTFGRRSAGRLPHLRGPALAGLGLLTAVLVLLAVAQVVLPGVAADSIRTRLRGDGVVTAVRVRAFPAVELLWHAADTVEVRMARAHLGTGQIARLLGDAGAVSDLSVTAGVAQVGLLRLHDIALDAHAGTIDARGRVTEADLRAAVPFLTSVVPVVSAAGGLVLRGSAGALGFAVSADATVAARGGALVVAPDVPFLAPVTVFADPRVTVESVSGSVAPGGFGLTVSGRLR